MSIRIMSAVWDGSAQTGGNLLLLLALADFANDEGECWPAVGTLAKKSRMTERHVRRILRVLEEAGEIERMEAAGQHGTNRYLVSPKTRADKMSSLSSEPPPLTLEVSPPDAGVPQSVNNRQKEPSTVDEETLKTNGRNFVDWFLKLLADTGAEAIKTTATDLENWADVYEKLIRIDKRTGKEIAAVCRWARGNDFWCSNFLSPAKLRKKNRDGVLYFDVFNNRMKTDGNTTAQKPHSRGFSGSNLDAFAELDRKMATGA